MIRHIVASDIDKKCHVIHPKIITLVFERGSSTQLVEKTIEIIEENDIQKPQVVLVTGRNNLRPENWDSNHLTPDFTILQAIKDSIFNPVKRLHHLIRSRGGHLKLGTMLPHPRNHCPIQTVHNFDITKTLRNYHDEVNREIDVYNKKNHVRTVPIHRFAEKRKCKNDELRNLLPAYEEDLYTPDKELSEKISTLCFNAIVNRKPKKKIKSIVQIPKISTLRKILKKPTNVNHKMRMKKKSEGQHQDMSVSSTTA